MGTYVIRETVEMVERFNKMERTLTGIFQDLQKNDFALAREKLGSLVKECKNDSFVIEPVLATLSHMSRLEGRPAAADAAQAMMKICRGSNAGLDRAVSELKAVFEGTSVARIEIPIVTDKDSLRDFLAHMRRRMVGLG